MNVDIKTKQSVDSMKVIHCGNKEFLTLLRSLSEIPPHLYISSERVRPSKVECVFVEPANLGNGHVAFRECFCNENAKNPKVVLQKDENNIATIVHDLTHRIVDGNFEEFTEKVFALLNVKNFEELKNRLGYRTNGNLELGMADIREFISVAAEYYLQGKVSFRAVYREFLREEETEMLYGLLRDNIFRNKEY